MAGMRKHARSGHTVNCAHFTGKSSNKGTPRKQRLSTKQKKAKMFTHQNKYVTEVLQ